MTLVSEHPPAPAPTTTSGTAPAPSRRPSPPAVVHRRLTGRRTAALALTWLLVAVVGLGVAATTLGALKESRSQRAHLTALRQQLSYAQAASRSLFGANAPAAVPATGAGVALLQVPRIGLQRVVLEGARAGDTQDGPGHVPGTAGLGQPGNAAVVGRRTTYGAAFARLADLRTGDDVLVTTVQGQSVYRVSQVRRTGADVLGPTADDRLTLVTAAGRGPLGWSRPLVVTATLRGRPFPATAQGTRTAVSDGRHGDRSALPTVVIWATLLVLAAGSAVLLYRRWLLRSTYLLTTPALVALVVLLGDAVARLLPAWV